MKSTWMYLALLMTLPVISMAQSVTYSLSGTTKGIGNGEVELSSYDSRTRKSQKIATTKLINGKFVLKGKLDGAQMLGLNIKPGNWGTQVFVDGGNVSLQIDTVGAQHFDYTAYGMEKGASLKSVKITGSKGQSDYEQYEQSYMAADRKSREAVFAAQLGFIKPYVDKNSSSVAGVYMLSNHYLFNSGMPLDEFEALLAKFTGPARNSLYFSNLQKEVTERKAVLPGNMADDFTLLKRDSTKFTLSSTRGKYVMIDFWASWCKPCREAIPHWKTVYQKYKDKGFEIVSVTNDSRWPDWFKAMDAEQMPWVQVADEFPVKNMPARVISKYKHGTIPLYVLLDKEGKILAKTGEEAEIDKILAEVMP